MARTQRTHRRTGIRVALGERDKFLLKTLNRLRIARTGDLRDLTFANVHPHTVARRLRRLLDAGFLSVLVTDHLAENVYRLGPAGARWIVEQGGEVGRPPRGGFAHHLGVVSAWLGLARAAAEMPDVELRRVWPEWELRERVAAGSMLVVPDALVELRSTLSQSASEPIRIVLELDRGTEMLAVLREKLRTYATVRRASGGLFGWVDFSMAIALDGLGEERADAVRELLAASWSGPSAVWRASEGPSTSLRSLVRAAVVGAVPGAVAQQQVGESK